MNDHAEAWGALWEAVAGNPLAAACVAVVVIAGLACSYLGMGGWRP